MCSRPLRPIGLPIYVARRPAAPFMRIAVLVVSTFVMASVYAQQPLSDEKQILKLEDDWARALKTKDRQILDALVASNFTFIEPDGTVKDRDEYLADRSSDIAAIDSFELADLKVSVFKNCALASGLSKITAIQGIVTNHQDNVAAMRAADVGQGLASLVIEAMNTAFKDDLAVIFAANSSRPAAQNVRRKRRA